MTACECDYDFEYTAYPDGHYFRCNNSILCPEHDLCIGCDERLAVAIFDGDKLCNECLKDAKEEAKREERFMHPLQARW